MQEKRGAEIRNAGKEVVQDMRDAGQGCRDVNDNTSSSIIKLRYRIVSIAKRNENVQKCLTVIESKI